MQRETALYQSCLIPLTAERQSELQWIVSNWPPNFKHIQHSLEEQWTYLDLKSFHFLRLKIFLVKQQLIDKAISPLVLAHSWYQYIYSNIYFSGHRQSKSSNTSTLTIAEQPTKWYNSTQSRSKDRNISFKTSQKTWMCQHNVWK